MTEPLSSPSVTFVIVPGLRDHVEDHWQTHLARQWEAQSIPCLTVPPLAHDKLSRAARVQALHQTLLATHGPVVLVAHSAGCITTVHWAQQYGAQWASRIRGALLATPADVEMPMPAGYPTQAQLTEHGWCPVPRTALPFPTVVAASRNDPLAPYPRLASLAADWQARLVDLGDVGHLNPAAGYGPWSGVHALLQPLV